MKIFIYDKNDAAADRAVKKLSEMDLEHGMFVALTEDEFVAMRDSVMSIDIGEMPPDRTCR